MKISTRARYGTRLMLELGLYYGKAPIFLKDIARREEISEKYLSQIIIPLKAQGLVSSFRGAKGGYLLSKPPSQITIKEIVEILEGGLNLLRCVRDLSVRHRASKCATRDVWGLLEDKITNTLSSITLEDLVKIYKEKQESILSYNI